MQLVDKIKRKESTTPSVISKACGIVSGLKRLILTTSLSARGGYFSGKSV